MKDFLFNLKHKTTTKTKVISSTRNGETTVIFIERNKQKH